jgi:hypothetical protein
MNCTHDCNQGRECACKPRQGDVLTITVVGGKTFQVIPAPEEPDLWDRMWNWAVSLLASIGLMAVAGGVGLYFAGFFEFLGRMAK